jgi:hypothetical protein
MTVEPVPDASVPEPPDDAKAAGQRLWRSILADYDLSTHETVLLTQAVRVTDLCEDLQAIVTLEGPLVMGKAHPALVELRMQRILLARLIVALRVPLGDEDAAGAPRTQYRGVRGVYGIRGGVA